MSGTSDKKFVLYMKQRTKKKNHFVSTMKYCTFIIVFCFIGVAVVRAECQSGWLHYSNSCYYISTYHMSWADAYMFCRTHNSYLASIETRGENNFLADEIARIKTGVTKRHGTDNDFWIGGTDRVSEGEWIWVATDTPVTYTNWARGQPDNHANEDCLEIVQWSGRIGKFNDDECTDLSRFICEKR